MAIEFIFVYGTLRKKTATNMSHILTRYCEYCSDGYIHGKLYNVNQYPATIESNNSKDKVYGEIYQIVDGDLILHQLDAYEECTDKFPEPHEYTRKKIPVTLSNDANIITAWVYIFNHDISNLIQIKSGDYLA